MVICGLPDETTCPCEFLMVKLGRVMVVLPLPTPWKIMVASTPEPLASTESTVRSVNPEPSRYR